MYYLEVQTADERDAGTNSDISVQFTSANGIKSSKHKLDNPGDDFERNYNDFYKLEDGSIAAGDNLVSVSITHDGGSAWKPAWLKVSHEGKTWEALVNDWLNNETKVFQLTPAVGRLNWMSALSSNTTIDQINIPGTHDSGTSYLNSPNYHKTHDLTISEQLLLGIRYFDVRLRCVVNPNWQPAHGSAAHANFAIHHEADWCYLYFDKESWLNPDDTEATKGYVLQDLLAFLKEYPSEFVLLQIQREYNTEPDFDTYFKELIGRHDAASFLITNTYPTYEQAKGKIVILNMNDALVNYGIPIHGPKLLDTPTLYIENHWMDSNKEIKWDKVETALRVALKENPGQWVINFVSDGSGALHPRDFASSLNSWVENFITENGKTRHYGTILTDFPTRSLVAAILDKYLK